MSIVNAYHYLANAREKNKKGEKIMAISIQEARSLVDSWLQAWESVPEAQEQFYDPPGIGNGMIYRFFAGMLNLGAVRLVNPGDEMVEVPVKDLTRLVQLALLGLNSGETVSPQDQELVQKYLDQ